MNHSMKNTSFNRTRWMHLFNVELESNQKQLRPKEFTNLKYYGECTDEYLLANSKQILNRFSKILYGIVERHGPIVLVLAQGLEDFHQSNPQVSISDPAVQSFLDGFHQARVGIRLLVGHHLVLSSITRNQISSGFIGIVCTKTNIEEVAKEASEAAMDVCQATYGVAPSVNLSVILEGNCNNEKDFIHIPSHLHYILFELLKNAMRSVVEKEISRQISTEDKLNEKLQELSFLGWILAVVKRKNLEHAEPGSHNQFINCDQLSPIQIIATVTNDTVLVEVKDRGTGISQEDMSHIFQYAYSSVKTKISGENNLKGSMNNPELSTMKFSDHMNDEHGRTAPMAGFGYGLPLSRL
ncbi:hypothetical protein HK096_011050, partial [Nowakowskiella sp. JEL0078]